MCSSVRITPTGPVAGKRSTSRGAVYEMPVRSPRRGMCFLWNLEASQGGDLGPNLSVAWSTDVLAAVL